MPSLESNAESLLGRFSYRFNRGSIWRQVTERVVHATAAVKQRRTNS